MERKEEYSQPVDAGMLKKVSVTALLAFVLVTAEGSCLWSRERRKKDLSREILHLREGMGVVGHPRENAGEEDLTG